MCDASVLTDEHASTTIGQSNRGVVGLIVEDTRLVPDADFSNDSIITRADFGSSSWLCLKVPIALFRCGAHTER